MNPQTHKEINRSIEPHSVINGFHNELMKNIPFFIVRTGGVRNNIATSSQQTKGATLLTLDLILGNILWSHCCGLDGRCIMIGCCSPAM